MFPGLWNGCQTRVSIPESDLNFNINRILGYGSGTDTRAGTRHENLIQVKLYID